MIEFKEVCKSFKDDFWKKPKEVLKSLSFTVPEGSLCGFLGANGAGKTTSVKALLKFINIDSGAIEFLPQMGSSFDEIRSNIGYFPERPYFYPYMTGREFCTYLGKLQGVGTSELVSQVRSWSSRLNIEYALDSQIRSYSKGMLQRLGFLSSVIHSPTFIILDEPLSGLDPVGRKEFKDALVELNNSGITVFFSSHIVSDVEEICNSLVVIRKGELFYNGKTKDILKINENKKYRFVISNLGTETDQGIDDIEVISRGDGKIRGFVSPELKNKVIADIIKNKNLEILEISPEKPTLEEVIYSEKSNVEKR